MPIENRNLKPGTKLTADTTTKLLLRVVENAEGKLRFLLEDGRESRVQSAAGMAITDMPATRWVSGVVITEKPLLLQRPKPKSSR